MSKNFKLGVVLLMGAYQSAYAQTVTQPNLQPVQPVQQGTQVVNAAPFQNPQQVAAQQTQANYQNNVNQLQNAPVNGVPSAAPQQAATPAPVTPPPIPKMGEGVDPAVLAAAYNNVFPLSDKQVENVLKNAASNYAAQNLRIPAPAKGVGTLVKIDLSPGAAIPVVRTTPNVVSTLVMTDSTGQPWPILQAVSGSPQFTVYEPTPGLKTNMVSVTAQGYGHQSNLTLFLEGAAAPVSFTLLSDQKTVDYRMDAMVMAAGPNAKSVTMGAGYASAAINTNTQLQELLQGVTPKGLQEVSVRGQMSGSVQAWSDAAGRRLYIRSSMPLISPSAYQVGRLVDGTYGYTIPRSEIVSFMNKGKVYDIQLSNLPSAGSSAFLNK